MDQRDLETWQNLSAYIDRFEAITHQLALLFPEFPNRLAWRETISESQEMYRGVRPDLSDLRLYIAQRWFQLAKDGHLKVTMHPSKGLIVQEALDDSSQQVNRRHFEKLLFNLINKLPNNQLLQIHEVQTAFITQTGQSLKNHEQTFFAVVNDLCEKQYIRCDRRGMLRFARALDFDNWSEEMTSKPSVTGLTNNTTNNFNGPVGAVQTGENAMANVHQTLGANPYVDLKSALQSVLKEFSAADIPEPGRTDAQELIQSAINEIDKPKPSKLSLKALLAGVATTVQTLGSTSDAVKALTVAIAAVTSLF